MNIKGQVSDATRKASKLAARVQKEVTTRISGAGTTTSAASLRESTISARVETAEAHMKACAQRGWQSAVLGERFDSQKEAEDWLGSFRDRLDPNLKIDVVPNSTYHSEFDVTVKW